MTGRLAAALCVLGCVAFAAEFQRYTSSAGGFSVELPVTPKESSRMEPGTLGTGSLSFEDDRAVWDATCTAHMSAFFARGLNAVLDDAREAHRADATTFLERPLSGVPGREFYAEHRDGSVDWVRYSVVPRTRQVCTLILKEKKAGTVPDADRTRFLGSLRSEVK